MTGSSSTPALLLHLAAERFEVAEEHKLLAPTLLRSQTLSALYEVVHRGELSADVARDRLAYIGRMKMRLLGAWSAREACHRAGSSRSMPRVTSRSSCSWNQTVWYESRLSATSSSSPCLARSSADARRGP